MPSLRRRFLLEWLSFLHRYIPVGLLEVQAAAMNWRSPGVLGRNDLETLFASEHPADWVRALAPPGQPARALQASMQLRCSFQMGSVAVYCSAKGCFV